MASSRYRVTRRVAERMPGEAFHVATLYHEWFMVDNAELSADDRRG